MGHFLPSAVFGALSRALPGQLVAPGADGLWDTQLFGEHPETGRRWTYVWFSAGGTGARPSQDGLSATAYPSGIAGVPVEVIETLAPIIVGQRALRRDSGGAGRFRGGLGQTMQLAVRSDKPFMFSGLYDRIRLPAPGLMGGAAGAAGALRTENPGIDLRPKTRTVLPAGTEITIELPGGGGFGAPYERDASRVLDDLRNGYVSAEAARDQYGVIVDPARMVILSDETAARRAEMKKQGTAP